MAFADELLTIVLSPIWGVLSDRVGTRPIAVFGTFMIGITFSFYTLGLGNNVYPNLILRRLLFAIGGSGAASMITAILTEISVFRIHPKKMMNNLFLKVSARFSRNPHNYHSQRADIYSDDEERGNIEGVVSPSSSHVTEEQDDLDTLEDDGFLELAEPGTRNGTGAAIVGLCSGLGAVIAVFVLLSLPLTLDPSQSHPDKALKQSYMIVSCLAIATSVFLFFGLHNDKNKGWNAEGNFNLKSYFELLKKGYLIALEEKRILLAYSASFVARSTTVATTMFIPLAINIHYHSQGRCDAAIDPNAPNSDLKSSCPKAYLAAVITTGIAQTVSLLFAPIWGYTTNRFGRKATLLVSCLIGFTGFVGYACTYSSKVGVSYMFGGFMGAAQIGVIITSMSLCTDTKRDSSGAIAGVYSFAGGLGILFLSKFGGWLTDYLAASAFIIMAVFYGLLALVTAYHMYGFEKILIFLRLRKESRIQL